jgi:hypothetical protein
MQISVTVQVEISARASLDELEEAVVRAGRQAMQRSLRAAIAGVEARERRCPHCGERAARAAGTGWRLLLTRFGAVRVPLSRRQCRGCARHYRPAGRLIAALDGANVTAGLARWCADAGASWPYAAAAGKVREWSGARVSAETVRRLTNQAGCALVAQEEARAAAVVAPGRQQVRDQPRCQADHAAVPAVLVVQFDGGWLASRDQAGGMEAKLGLLYTDSQPLGGDRRALTPRRYVSTLGNGAQVATLAYAAAGALGAQAAPTQVVLGDGASWISTAADVHFPTAVRILDWAHLERTMRAAIRAACPGSQAAPRARRRALYRTVFDALWQGEVATAQAQLAMLRPAMADPLPALEDALRYLETQRPWLGDYAAWREAGYPIGSGAIERAVAIVINARMKRRGMRWRRRNAAAVLALRVHTFNTTWEQQCSRRFAA